MQPADLVRDSRDGRVSHSKVGVLIAGMVFTLKMLGLLDRVFPDTPDDPVLWAVFMGTVGGYAVLLKVAAWKLRGNGYDNYGGYR